MIAAATMSVPATKRFGARRMRDIILLISLLLFLIHLAEVNQINNLKGDVVAGLLIRTNQIITQVHVEQECSQEVRLDKECGDALIWNLTSR
jgi:hypothetical protein